MRMLASTQPLNEPVPQFGEGKANRMLSREKDLGIVKDLVIAVMFWKIIRQDEVASQYLKKKKKDQHDT